MEPEAETERKSAQGTSAAARASGKSAPAQLSLRNKALGLLARREHSRHELYQKLKSVAAKAAYETADVEPELVNVLNALVDQGLLSDERFTEAYVNMRARKGYGPQRISLELAEKGIVQELAQVYLNEREDWLEQLGHTWQKKFRRPPADFAEKAKQMRFLQYRGFYPEQIKNFIDSLSD